MTSPIGWTVTFVVRLTRDDQGCITGIVEQVKTGLKVRVEGLDAIGPAIGGMVSSREHGQGCDTEEERGFP